MKKKCEYISDSKCRVLAHRKKISLAAAGTALLLAVGVLAGCSAATGSSFYSTDTAEVTADYSAASTGSGELGMKMYSNEAAADMEYEAAAAADSWDGGSSGSTVSEAELKSASADTIQRKLIKTVNIQAQTREFDTVSAMVEQKVTELGGYIESSGVYGTGYNGDGARISNYTIRIPADKLDEFIDTALESVKVISRSESVEDVTLTYTDLESKVKALETEEDRLYELMAQADSMDAIVTIETRLSEIRYELESIKSSLRVYDNQVTYSTVYLNIDEVEVTSSTASSTFSEKVQSGMASNVAALGHFLENAAIFLISSLPVIAAIAIPVIIVIVLLRAAARKYRRKKGMKDNNMKEAVSETKPDTKSEKHNDSDDTEKC